MKNQIIITIIGIVILSSAIVFIKKQNNHFVDIIKYNNKNYVLLEYKMDIFTYYHNSNNYYEEDIIHNIRHNKWDVVYFNGDLFILDKQIKKAIKYYSNDKNYSWYIVFDNGDEQIKKSIQINKEELSYLYNIEKKEKNKAIIFDEIQQFADILKVSNDGLVQAIITLVKVDGNWYYKTEIMTDNDKEYVVMILDSLNDKIKNLN